MPTIEVDLTVDGIDTVLAELATFSAKIQTRHLRPAVNAAARIILAEVKRQAPRGNGFFRRSLIVVVKQRGGFVKAQVGQATQPKTYKRKRISGSQINRKGYAAPIHFIEAGTKPHLIQSVRAPGKRSALAFGKGKQRTFRTAVSHPGTKANNVLERAARTAAPAAGAAFRDKLASRLKLGKA